MESRALICLQAHGSLFTEPGDRGEVWDPACPSQELSLPPALCRSSSWNSSWSSQGLQLPGLSCQWPTQNNSVGKGFKGHQIPPLPWAGIPSTRPGCSKPHPSPFHELQPHPPGLPPLAHSPAQLVLLPRWGARILREGFCPFSTAPSPERAKSLLEFRNDDLGHPTSCQLQALAGLSLFAANWNLGENPSITLV